MKLAEISADDGSALIVFCHSYLASMLSKVKDLGGMTKDIFDFPGTAVFHFGAPGAGKFAIWSHKYGFSAGQQKSS